MQEVAREKGVRCQSVLTTSAYSARICEAMVYISIYYPGFYGLNSINILLLHYALQYSLTR